MLGSIGKKLSEVYAKGKKIIGDAFEGTGFDDPTNPYGAKRFQMKALVKASEDLQATTPVAKKLERIEFLQRNLESAYRAGKMTKLEYEKESIVLDKEYWDLERTPEGHRYRVDQFALQDRRWRLENEMYGHTTTTPSGRYETGEGKTPPSRIRERYFPGVHRAKSSGRGQYDLPLLSRLGKWLMD